MNIDRSVGRISAFSEIESLLECIHLGDDVRSQQIATVINHCKDAVKAEEKYIDEDLARMEAVSMREV